MANQHDAGRRRRSAALLFAGFLLGVLALQAGSGAYRVESGLYSDDAAHFMTGLLVRDYLVSGFRESPREFAEQYYVRYPKIAPLMWPPLFHVLLGVVLLPGWSPHVAALALVAMIGAWLAWRLHRMVTLAAGQLAGAVAVALLLTTPLVHAMTNVLMLDLLVAAFALEAVYWLAQYAASGERRHAVGFGLCAAGACLTKGNGLALALAPLIFAIVARRLDLFRSTGLWLAAAIVVILAGPLVAISFRLDAAIGDFGPVTPGVVAERAAFYGRVFWLQLGPLLAVLAAIGAVRAVARGATAGRTAAPDVAGAWLTLAVVAILFHLLNPTRVMVPRYVTMAFAPAIGLAVLAAWAIAGRIARAGSQPAAQVAATVAIAAGAWVLRPPLPAMAPLGYRDAVTQLAADRQLSGHRVLVISDEIGEGAFVSEAATLALVPAPTVVRGSKLLGSDDWMGAGFRLRFGSAEAVMAELEALHIDQVVVDESAEARRLPYFGQVQAIADTMPGRLNTVRHRPASPGGARRSLTFYKVAFRPAGPPKPIEIELHPSIGSTIRRQEP